MTIHWEPLTAERVSLCAPLWSDRQAYTPAEFRKALARLERLLDERRANGAVIFEDGRARAFGVTVFVQRAVVDRFLAAPHPQFGKRLLLSGQSGSSPDPVLDRLGIGEGNATLGLELVVVNSTRRRVKEGVECRLRPSRCCHSRISLVIPRRTSSHVA